jgi:mRNA interferase YafQ
MLDLRFGAQFKRDRRLCVKRGYDMGLLSVAVETLRIPAALPPQNRAHALTGNWAGYQECHLAPDWLLIYRVEGNELRLARTGTHADLFGI